MIFASEKLVFYSKLLGLSIASGGGRRPALPCRSDGLGTGTRLRARLFNDRREGFYQGRQFCEIISIVCMIIHV